MVVRKRLVEASTSDYFPNLARVPCIPTGCSLLDCVLGGGWARGRVSNVIGDKSVGKSLLAIEGCANFAQAEPKGKIFYREAEAAFDVPYAENLGLPPKRVDFGPEGIGTHWDTIEDLFEDLDKQVEACGKAEVPGFYIIDSLDAVGSRAELERKPGEATFGLEKQKLLGQLFRRLIRKLRKADMTVMVISQIRDKIGVTFGEKHSRSGGKALDFYAVQALWLSHLGIINQTVKGIKRATGVRIKAKCKKNKIAAPFRDCEFEISFGYGVDDIGAAVEWLEEVGAVKTLVGDTKVEVFLKHAYSASGNELIEVRQKVRDAVFAEWASVENSFAPKRRKYA